ncbi:MAG: diiron oxygenase [Alphaproteobacteria bacterium]
MIGNGYSYGDCLENAIKSAWTVDDCFQGRDFDFSKCFLPDRIAGVDAISCLDAREKRTLNQVRGNSYCHLFAFVEEYIIPMVLDHAREDVYGDEMRLRYLIQFASDETKHQAMLQRAMAQIEAGLGVSCGVVSGRENVARAVLGKARLTGLMLTSMIEWFTQLHYVEHVREDRDLDTLFRDILRYHWIDEAQHAKADSLLMEEVAAGMGKAERERAVDELLELGMAVDGLLAEQAELDIASLEKACNRIFREHEKDEIRRHQRLSYRWTFLVSGLRHPKFVRIVDELTVAGREKVAAAATALAS